MHNSVPWYISSVKNYTLSLALKMSIDGTGAVTQWNQVLSMSFISMIPPTLLYFFAQKYSIEKLVLFGSRARGTNTERSDIDIAVYGGDFDSFYWDVKEKVHSLLSFDVVEADKPISEELKQEIEKDGVIIYEKA